MEQYVLSVIRSNVNARGFLGNVILSLLHFFFWHVWSRKGENLPLHCDMPQLLLSSLIPSSMGRLKIVFSLFATPVCIET